MRIFWLPRPTISIWVRLSAAVSFALCLVDLAIAQDPPPAVPDAWRYGRRVDESALTYCVDPRDGAAPVEQEIANAIAGALLLEPKPFVVPNQSVTQEIDDLYIALLESCDIYLGFKLLPQAYPSWLTLTRAYYEASYVFVTANPDWTSLADMPRSEAIGSTLGTSADLRLTLFLQAQSSTERWRRFPMGSNEGALKAVLKGTVGASLVWQPALWSLRKSDAAYSSLRVIKSSPLPDTTEGVGAALLGRETFIRTAIDEAILALIRDGTIATILEKNSFPATAMP